MTASRGSVRTEVRIARSPDEVWGLVGDPERLSEWFPGITSCTVAGDQRTVTTEAGLTMPERLVTVDRLQRRLQYRSTAPLFREHLSTLDVLDLGAGHRLVVSEVAANPSVMALVIAGAAGAALDYVRSLMEEE